MKNPMLIYFVYFLLFISVMSILIVLWHGFRWVFSDSVKSDTYHDTGLVILLACGSSIFAAFLLNVG